MDFETILYEQRDGVAVITLNRPERHNAINLRMARELKQAWERVKADPEVVCTIVTGAEASSISASPRSRQNRAIGSISHAAPP